jgi:hypothetical protein
MAAVSACGPAVEQGSQLAVVDTTIYQKSCRETLDTRHLAIVALPQFTMIAFDANICAGAARPARAGLGLDEPGAAAAPRPARPRPLTLLVDMGSTGPNDAVVHIGISSTSQRLADAGLPVGVIYGAGGPQAIEEQMRILMRNPDFRAAAGDQPLNVIIEGHGSPTQVLPSPAEIGGLAGLFAASPLAGTATAAAVEGRRDHVIGSETLYPEAVAANVGKLVLGSGSPFGGLDTTAGAVAGQFPETGVSWTRTTDVMRAVDAGLRYTHGDAAAALGGGPLAAARTGFDNPTNYIVEACFAGAALDPAAAAGIGSVVASSGAGEPANTRAGTLQGLAQERYTDGLIRAVETGVPLRASDLLGTGYYPPPGVASDGLAAVAGSWIYGATTQTPVTDNPDAVLYEPRPQVQVGAAELPPPADG